MQRLYILSHRERQLLREAMLGATWPNTMDRVNADALQRHLAQAISIELVEYDDGTNPTNAPWSHATD